MNNDNVKVETWKSELWGLMKDKNITMDEARNNAIYNIMIEYGLVPDDLVKDLQIPKRTVENWIYGISKPTDYLIKLITCYYVDRRYLRYIYNRLEKAQDLIHDNRISEAIEIIDNI